MNMVYAVEGEVVLTSVEEKDKKVIEHYANLITQTAVEKVGVIVRDNSQLKYVDGVVILKDDQDFKNERIARAEESKKILLDACTKYQREEAKPRIDPNFFSLLATARGLKKMNPELVMPCCEENLNWLTTLWADYDQRKLNIDVGEVPDYDFSNNGNPAHSFDECNVELS